MIDDGLMLFLIPLIIVAQEFAALIGVHVNNFVKWSEYEKTRGSYWKIRRATSSIYQSVLPVLANFPGQVST